MENSKIYEIMGKVLTNCNSKADEEVLEAWLQESDENRQVFEPLRENWKAPALNNYSIVGSDEVKTSLWKRISKKNAPHKSISGFSIWYKIAAAIAFVTVSTFFLYQNSAKEISNLTEVAIVNKTNGPGRKSTVFLNDGSTVNLNSLSRISYPEVFSDTARIIHMEGEAFFDVTKDYKKPFIVVSQDIAVEVLGTSFNISAYQDADEIRISLAKGKVKIRSNSPSANSTVDWHYLEPGQEIVYKTSTKSFSEVTFFNSDKVFGWKNGKLIFEKANFETLKTQLERWYGVEINAIKKNLNQNMSYTGEFHNQSLKNVLESVGFVQNFDYEIDGKKVTIRFNPLTK